MVSASEAGGLVTCGEAMASAASAVPVPLRLGGELRLTIGGAESNVAIGVARLGHPAAWIGRVGADELGELVLRTLRAEGVDVGAARRDPAAPTGLMIKERRAGLLTRVHYYRARSAGSRLAASDIDEGRVAAAGLVHVTGITPALGDGPAAAVDALVAAARRHGVPVLVDVNHRSRLWPSDAVAARTLLALARAGEYVLASADELALFGGTAAVGELLSSGAAAVVVTRGAAGAELHTRDGVVTQPARPVDAVDTVGAGDALAAGFASGVLDGLALAEALARGVQVAAFAVSSPGDWEGLPARGELDLLALEEGATVR